MRQWWWFGALAAGIVAFAVYRGMQPSELALVAKRPPDVSAPNVASSPDSVPAAPANPSLPAAPSPASASPSAGGARIAGATKGANQPKTTAAVAANAAGPSAGGRSITPDPRATATTTKTPPPVPAVSPPVVPPVRLDSTRLTTRRDTSAGYGATRAAPPTSTPTPASSPPAAAKDSGEERIPPAPREIATALFREFANAINSRTYSRITGAYSQPSDPAAIKVWQDFLVFVRDYMPRATVRSTSVNESAYPPTITATIDFRWSSDAGFERVRSGSFVGIGVPIPGGWQLHRVQLAKKFW